MPRLLIQTQLSNYDISGKYILECDSGWNMMIGRIIEILKHNETLKIDILVPKDEQVLTKPEEIVSQYANFNRVKFLKQRLTNNAVKNRYDFNYHELENLLSDKAKEYTHVYINDPMLLRNFKSLFYLSFKCQPKFITHSHFIDNPENPKVPADVTYWYGQMETAIRSDYNFWQCESAMNVFFESMSNFYSSDIISVIKNKSEPWDDGYSSSEINTPIDYGKLRFKLPKDKLIVFIPNRVGGLGKSFDYTNAGKFMFGGQELNNLYNIRKDFIVVSGNPSQKISNDELTHLCKPYVKLVPGTFTRNEYRYIASKAHINVGLYDNDSYGGTAWRECIDLGCLPLSVNIYEYKLFFDELSYPFKVNVDFGNMIETLNDMLNFSREYSYCDENGVTRYTKDFNIRKSVLEKCSYEKTTPNKLIKMGL